MRWIYNCVFFFVISLNALEISTTNDGERDMSDHVFVVSEWLPKEGKDQELWDHAKRIMALTLKEKGCLRAHATRQIAHPGAPGTSKYVIILLQEYRNLQAFDIHCMSEYVTDFFQTYVQNEDSAIVEEWTCRLFNEGE